MPSSRVPKELELPAWRKLVMARLAEEHIRARYMGNEMKTPVHLGIGAEAISVGVCLALPQGSKCFGTYRNHNLYLALTEDLPGFFGELYGRATGGAKGKAGSMHLSYPSKGLIATSAVVGTTIPLAVGAALAEQYRGSKGVSAVFFGDGAVEEGAFWESLNFAAARGLRVLFVCEDNELAIHAPAKDRQGYRSLVDIAKQFDCVVERGDGSKLDEVYAKAAKAVDGMLKKGRPGFLHLDYFRFLEHVGINEDFHFGYRKKPSAAKLKTLDPVTNFEKALLAKRRTKAELENIKREVMEAVDAADAAAGRAPFAPPRELHEDVYA